MKRNGNNAFTLVEMLAVLVIMGIMIGIGIVAFTRVAQGAKLQTAGREFFNTARLTRQYAITHACQAMVVMPCDATPVSDIAPRFRSYAVMTNVNAHDSYGKDWGYLTGWRKLPEGVVFDFSSSGTTRIASNYFPTGSSPSTKQNLQAPTWRASGYLDGNQEMILRLREGYVEGGTNAVYTGTNSIEFRIWRSGALEMNRQ